MSLARQADAGGLRLHYGVTFPVSVQDCSPIRSELLIPLRGARLGSGRLCVSWEEGPRHKPEARREILSGIHAGIDVAAVSSYPYAVTESDDGLQDGSQDALIKRPLLVPRLSKFAAHSVEMTATTHLDRLSPAHAKTGNRVHESKDIEQPQNHADDDDGIQDRLDGTGHRYEVIDEPEENTDRNQDHDELN